MVIIQCPNCEEDIELEDDVYGLFDCPLCDEEFIWEADDNDEDVSKEYEDNFSPVGTMVKMVSKIVGVFILIWVGLGIIMGIAWSYG
tara:strand:+ start:128 stop:388 length:261 start_codon:yes stop_codon:yes gene_type:complete